MRSIKGVPADSEETSIEIDLNGVDQLKLFGNQDANLRLVNRSYRVKTVVRGDRLIVRGAPDEARLAAGVLERLARMVKTGDLPDAREIQLMLEYAGEPERYLPESWDDSIIYYPPQRRPILPKGPGQKDYVKAIRDNDIVVSIGPAGTGKTFLAVAMAVAALKRDEVSKIILVRPAVEAGESLGYLPGDLREKVDPYLRPLYDALHELIEGAKVKRYLEIGTIEVVPLAYMRGRTLNSAFVILDEAQNTTPKQMKMFLTRLGVNSKAVITGDITQIDLPTASVSGLIQTREILAGVPGISIVYLDERDVVRHNLVRKILKAYQKFEEGNSAPGGPEDSETGGKPS
ncbi:PhoH family protein [candidate division KSB1 bacterium]